MKNQNNKVAAVLIVVALALAPMVQARPHRHASATNGVAAASNPAATNLPVVSVYATDNVIRGKTGQFVLKMQSTLMLGGTYVFFSLSGTAVQGADYKLVASPVYVSQSGYGVINIDTLPDLRGGAINQAYSVIVTLTDGAGYALGKDSSAIMWIKPASDVPPNS